MKQTNWKSYRLDEVGKIVTGKTPPTRFSEYYGDEIPFITPSDMDGRKIIRRTERYLTKAGVQSVKGSIIPSRSVMVSCIGSDMGKIALSDSDCVTNQQINSIIVGTEFDADFIFYSLLPRKEEFLSLAGSGSTLPILNKSNFSELLIYAPLKKEQKRISEILNAFDEKIELNYRMNQTLEEMASTIFKSWFVDFDPVRAKVEGCDTGLPIEIADLYPDSFERSPLGKIPMGWRTGTLSEVFNLIMGQSPPGDTYNELGEGLPFYQGKTDFSFRYPKRRVFCTEPTRFASFGDTLVSVRAPVGSINMAIEKCAIGRGVASIRHKTGSRSYTYYSMRFLHDIFHKFEAEGTVFGAINKNDFSSIRIIIPPPEIVGQFENLCSPLDSLIEKNEKEIITLVGLRDSLLPKLLNGEIVTDCIQV